MTIDRLCLIIITACLVVAMVVTYGTRAQAAAPDVPDCEAINTAGGITVYRCEPDNGSPYLINSLGFMLVED